MTKYKYFPEKPGALINILGARITDFIQVDEDSSYYLTAEIAGYLLHIRVPANRLNRPPHRGDEIHAHQVEVHEYGFRVDGEPYVILYSTHGESTIRLEQP